MSWRAILRRPWRRLTHPYLLAMLSWLSLPVRVVLLAAWIRRQRIDIVYTNTATMIDGALAARLCGIPHVWHFREVVAGNADLVSLIPVGWLPAFALRHSSVVIVNSHALGRQLFDLPLPAKLAVIHNGIDLPPSASIPAAPPIPDLPAQSRLTAICGALQANKGILTYVRSAALLRDSHPQLHHLIIGHGQADYLELVRQEIARFGLSERMHLLGYRNDFLAMLPNIDILVSCSRKEAFGRTLVEAMAAGKPVIATRSGGPEEIIVDGKCGFLVDVDDATAIAENIAKLLDDAALYVRMCEAARVRAVNDFGLNACVGKIEDIFDQACMKPSG